MSILSSKKYIILIFVTICVLVFTIFLSEKSLFAFKKPAEALPIILKVSEAKEKTIQQAKTNNSDKITSGKISTAQPEWPTVMGSPADAAEVSNWFNARGYNFDKSSHNEYASYDLETLDQLAKNGDVRAMKYWGDAIYGTVDGFDKAKSSYINAAIHGSTDAMESMGSIIENRYLLADTKEEKKREAIEALSWYKAASYRGDKWPDIASGDSFIKRKHLELSNEDNKAIQDRAQEIYNDLLQKRKDLGLGDFDNSVPDTVNRYFDFLEGKNK